LGKAVDVVAAEIGGKGHVAVIVDVWILKQSVTNVP
jgi:hypothetical protein